MTTCEARFLCAFCRADPTAIAVPAVPDRPGETVHLTCGGCGWLYVLEREANGWLTIRSHK